jgi:hypothetical protein
MEYYRGHLIAYSLGDFAGYGNFSTTGSLALAGALRVSLDGFGQPTDARFISLRLDANGRPAVDPMGAGARLVNDVSAVDFGPDAVVIGRSGEIRPAR